jgi:hypothetical protein
VTTTTPGVGVLCGVLEGQRAGIVTQAFPPEQDALQQRTMPAARASTGAAPGPRPAGIDQRAAHPHAVNQAVGASGGDSDAGRELLTGVSVDGRVVVMGGQDIQRLDNGLKRREGKAGGMGTMGRAEKR